MATVTFHRPRRALVRVKLPSAATAPRQARKALSAALTAHGLDGFADVAAVVVSELVTNAVRYAGGERVGLRVRQRRGMIVCEVSDNSAELPKLSVPGSDAEHGRGLMLIASLSADHGVRRRWHGHGKTCWCALAADPEDQP